MPSHFEEYKRTSEVPPWAADSEPVPQSEMTGLYTTNQWFYKGRKATPGVIQRNNTTNKFDRDISWRNKSTVQETVCTPQAEFYSRHVIKPASVNRKHNPHSKCVWPLEPFKQYMIYKRDLTEQSQRKPYEGLPALTRSYSGQPNHWKTTTNMDFFVNPVEARQALLDNPPLTAGVGGDARGVKATAAAAKSNAVDGEAPQSALEQRVSASNMRSALEQRNSALDMRSALEKRNSALERRNTALQKRAPATADPLMKTTYQKYHYTPVGGRPATNERPIDYSWRNINY